MYLLIEINYVLLKRCRLITRTQQSSSASTCRSSQRGSSAKKPETRKNDKNYSPKQISVNWGSVSRFMVETRQPWLSLSSRRVEPQRVLHGMFVVKSQIR